jgi:hypothetical protein
MFPVLLELPQQCTELIAGNRLPLADFSAKSVAC